MILYNDIQIRFRSTLQEYRRGCTDFAVKQAILIALIAEERSKFYNNYVKFKLTTLNVLCGNETNFSSSSVEILMIRFVEVRYRFLFRKKI